jgi:tRNA A37 threonylcarbamoyladenosine synthetase subunit TsaC/SUA5/YrdC
MRDPAARSRGIAAAVAALRRGELVAMPTETVYGLAADAGNAMAVEAIFLAKARPRFNPLIVHVESRAAAAAIATFSVDAERLAERFWPGPLTLVLPGGRVRQSPKRRPPGSIRSPSGCPTMRMRRRCSPRSADRWLRRAPIDRGVSAPPPRLPYRRISAIRSR